MITTGLPVVKFACGLVKEIGRSKWVVRSGGVETVRQQLPLALAWAFSIHKAQVGKGLLFKL